MTSSQHVLVGLDLQNASASAILARACQLASPDEIEVVHVSDRLHNYHEDYGVSQFANTEELDEQIIAEVDARLVEMCGEYGITHRKVLRGNTADSLHEYALEQADLIVVGSHGRHGMQTLFGSTSNATVHGTPCDVLAVHIDEDDQRPRKNYRHILIALNLEDESTEVLEHGMGIARTTDAGVSLCHVYAGFDKKTQAQEQRDLAALGAGYDVPRENQHSLIGGTVRGIHDLAKELDVDLVVVGTHGKHGVELIKGSTANAVLHSLHCDALTVRVGAG
jgi:universal stress protein A